jgi:hypothetical protein
VEALAELSPSVVYVTNRNHIRAAAAFRDRFSIPVRVHEATSKPLRVDADDAAVEGPIGDGDVTAIHVPGKSPGELAFHVPARLGRRGSFHSSISTPSFSATGSRW